MKIVKGYDKEIVKDIINNCGSSNVKKTSVYLRTAIFYSKNNFECFILDNNAFFAGTINKKHFRLLEIAVRKEMQSKGYGKTMIRLLKRVCSENKLNKITFRTSKSEDAVEFFKKQGAEIIGQNGEDWEMELNL